MKRKITIHLKLGKNGYSHIIPKKKPIKKHGFLAEIMKIKGTVGNPRFYVTLSLITFLRVLSIAA